MQLGTPLIVICPSAAGKTTKNIGCGLCQKLFGGTNIHEKISAL